MSDDGASKNDQAKADLSLLPKVFLEEVARAFMVGEKKYGRYNYCKGHKASQLIAAAQRHLTAWYQGEEHDPVDGQHHLGAASACMAMALRQMELGTLKDDRFKAEPSPTPAQSPLTSDPDVRIKATLGPNIIGPFPRPITAQSFGISFVCQYCGGCVVAPNLSGAAYCQSCQRKA